ncbi:hypothetical protein GGTG_05246 [Gaeumannomyces tritici R3-111a-1]|uniref:Uncharacterized protein n=1 Tax=Gaeumannomyces tritici (strain R3-111a-1) TaxID=644352 RepID=J3NVD3_GAET3|nr:hypothetical protein GGTG_05246 [Gaeumannomyces tritici R3-111a-1]EJT75309.1 hypothetical protein GGTG_05246 [Gaeumannomyces tritici R3-111a-1]
MDSGLRPNLPPTAPSTVLRLGGPLSPWNGRSQASWKGNANHSQLRSTHRRVHHVTGRTAMIPFKNTERPDRGRAGGTLSCIVDGGAPGVYFRFVFLHGASTGRVSRLASGVQLVRVDVVDLNGRCPQHFLGQGGLPSLEGCNIRSLFCACGRNPSPPSGQLPRVLLLGDPPPLILLHAVARRLPDGELLAEPGVGQHARPLADDEGPRLLKAQLVAAARADGAGSRDQAPGLKVSSEMRVAMPCLLCVSGSSELSTFPSSYYYLARLVDEGGRLELIEVEIEDGLTHSWASVGQALAMMAAAEPASELGRFIQERDIFLRKAAVGDGLGLEGK